ncbi:hypothetical protein MNBD_GAMMA20-1818 [hydrothermal vent metagenome]|uniref:Chemotaxis protein CheW n=1 Tax=hydrothermal vent metagenome TaxID=652676 RepID=A0A3B1BK25_9ZZZZ
MKKETEKPDDCWNKIGVWAYSSIRCERLQEVVHCRNCEVFVAAGKQIFEQELPPGYQQENLAILADVDTVTDQDCVSIIVFRLGVEYFSLPANVFETVTESRPVHRLPHVNSPYVKGVVNVSGKVCLCHSLMTVLAVDACCDEFGEKERHAYKRLIVVNFGEGRYVFPVDAVKGMASYRPEQLKPAPATIDDEIRPLILGTFQDENDRVVVLNTDELHRMLYTTRTIPE